MAQGRGIPKSQWPARRMKWAQHIGKWSKSSLSQAEYCRQHSLDQATFSSWKRRLGLFRAGVGQRGPGGGQGQQAAGVGVATSFLPLRVAEARSDTGAILAEVILLNGRVLRVGRGSDPAAVGRLAAALERDGAAC